VSIVGIVGDEGTKVPVEGCLGGGVERGVLFNPLLRWEGGDSGRLVMCLIVVMRIDRREWDMKVGPREGVSRFLE
jgi:hypothetical protein